MIQAIITFFAQSSADPGKLSATLTGLIIAASSYIIFVGVHILGVPVNLEQVSDFAALVGTTAGSIFTIFGILRKVWYATLHKFGKTA